MKYFLFKLNISKESYAQITSIWDKCGQFKYENYIDQINEIPHTQDFYLYFKQNSRGTRSLLIGQLASENQKISQGLAIEITEKGEFFEGLWENGFQHGHGRCIF